MRPSDLAYEFGKPVAYYPGLVKYLGSVNAVLMFCQLFYWSGKEVSELGIYKSVEEIEHETGMSYREQVTARKQLVSRGVLIETHKRLEHRIYFKIDTEKLNEIIESANCETCNSPNAESAVRGVRKAQFDHTENTSENTSSCEQQADSPVEQAEKQSQIPYDEIKETYNRVCGSTLGQALKLTDARKRAIKKLWNTDWSGDGAYVLKNLTNWEKYFTACLANSHWTGNNDRGWKANLDFLTRESTALRVFES